MRQRGDDGSIGPYPADAAAARAPRRGQSLSGTLLGQLEAEQERWFLWLPVMLGAGIALYFLLPAEPAPAVAVLPLVAAIAVRRAGGGGIALPLAGAAMIAIAAGFALAKVRTHAVGAPVIGRATGPVAVEGFVELVEPRAGKGQRLTIRPLKIERVEPGTLPYRIRVRTLREAPDLKPGDAVRLSARLSPPPTPALPGDYDFARTAWFARLGAVGYAAGAAETLADPPAAPAGLRAWAAIERVRQAIGQRVTAALPGETGAIANALITGERGGISEATSQAFRDSGLYHILSISGLHMTVIAGAAFVLLRVLLAAWPAVALRYPTKKWAAVGAMLASLGYLLISGSAFATVRSWVMISIMLLAVLADRPAIALRNVALAALAILAVWPESLLDAGFQMSFAAVVALVSAYEWLRERRQAREPAGSSLVRGLIVALLFLGGIVVTTLIASLAVAPFGIYHFHATQSFAVLANLIAIPICNLLVMPAALAGLIALPVGLEAGPLWVMGLGIEGMVWCAEAVARLPGAVGRVAAIPSLAFGLVVAGGLWLTLWRERWRVLGLVPIAAGLAAAGLGPVRPDVLVGRGAELVAVRGSDGRLSALAARGTTFELQRWLEHEGDGRTPAAAARAEAWRCDALGCTARVKGLTVAVARTPAALRDDCGTAAIVVLRFQQAAGCRAARLVIDRGRVAALGAHAVWITREDAGDGGATGATARLRLETVQAARGLRPWAVATAQAPRHATEMAAPTSPQSADEARDDP
ncbi:MAG: ComEC/Rec2 family competence protein [Hyphomicrobiaceae bacterium]|nr:ComEC/Rec2 family competence protein [Hyphomicrobiaceae bacterium]